MKPTFRKGDKVVMTARGRRSFRRDIWAGVVTSDQRRQGFVTVRAGLNTYPTSYATDFWELKPQPRKRSSR